ncbi:MAG: HD domain-containing protein [Candidatus Magasanikbacteria bacterium]|nr:HD domain-containing protein [Candidatus Magasanikbacteria bacterium]
MTRIKYTKAQLQLLTRVKAEVKRLFDETPVRVHGYDHTSRVAAWARQIAHGEKARDLFLCELAAWLHDIGRVKERVLSGSDHAHHELSYQLLRQWFKKDRKFDLLTRAEKIELLYAVRYHWNHAARKYDTALILRDADKLDGFGVAGVKRGEEAFKGDEEGLNQNFRYQYSNYLQLETKCAIMLVKQHKLLKPVDLAYYKYLRSKISPVKL